ncbi:MAG: efflux transporter outer membrane subunit [Planctomycetes bacterium]|nr:efflux transporter outer membrane subunit [Planctomycetota bacterium]
MQEAPRICAGLLVATAAACANFVAESPRELPVELPATFAAAPPAPAEDAGAEPVLDAWWRSFRQAPALAEVVETALARNQDLVAAAARLDAALARARIAGADLGPQLGARLDLGRRRQNFVGLPIPGSSGVLSNTTDAHAFALDLSWEIDLWGRIRAGELAAERDVETSAAELRAARLSIAARAAKGWFRCVEAAQQLALAEATARNFAATEQQVQDRFERGVRPALDLRLARSDRAAAESLVERRRRELDGAVRDLELLLGRYPAAALEPGTTLPELPGPVPAGLPSELLLRRPDLVAADRRVAAADARLGEARAARYPQLTLTASAGTSSDQLGDLVDLDYRVWSLGAGLLAPLLQGGRLAAAVDLRDAQRREVLAGWAQSVLVAFREVEAALRNEELIASELQRRVATLAEARAARELSADRYGRGLTDVTTLLQSQRSELSAETEWLSTRRLALDTRVDLLLALGGGLPAPNDDTNAAGARGDDGRTTR